MSKINSYLTFGGNCREAMGFYRQCLGGELSLQTAGETPLGEKMPAHMKERILHASLTLGDLVLMGSDMVSDQGLVIGNAVSLMLNCDSEADIKRLFTSLSEGGQVLHPLENTFWGAMIGDLKDRFGNTWMLHFDKEG